MKVKTSPVLIIDDQSELADLVAAVLRSEGYWPAVALDGAEGIRLARETTPTLILCDSAMPGLSGKEVIATLRSEAATAAVPIVMMSGHDRAELEGSGADALLSKPFQLKELLALVASILPTPSNWEMEPTGDLLEQGA